MTCNKCGFDAPKGAEVCPYCGESLSTKDIISIDWGIVSAPVKSVEIHSKKSKFEIVTKVVFIILISVVVFAILALLWFPDYATSLLSKLSDIVACSINSCLVSYFQ